MKPPSADRNVCPTGCLSVLTNKTGGADARRCRERAPSRSAARNATEGVPGYRHITGFGCQNPLAADRNVCPTGHFAAKKTRRGRGLAWATLPLKYLSQRCQPRCRSVIRQNYLAGGVVPGAFSPGFAGAPAPAFLLSSFFGAGLPQPTTENIPKLKINAIATNFFMCPPFLTRGVIGDSQQETLLPAVALDTRHWEIIPHKVQWGRNSSGCRQFF